MKNISIAKVNVEVVRDLLHDFFEASDVIDTHRFFGEDNIDKIYEKINGDMKEVFHENVIIPLKHVYTKELNLAYNLINGFGTLVLIDNDGEVVGLESTSKEPLQTQHEWARLILNDDEFSSLLVNTFQNS